MKTSVFRVICCEFLIAISYPTSSSLAGHFLSLPDSPAPQQTADEFIMEIISGLRSVNQIEHIPQPSARRTATLASPARDPRGWVYNRRLPECWQFNLPVQI